MTHLKVLDMVRGLTTLPALLATRPTGKRFWAQLLVQLQSSAPDELVVLSLAGVEIMDASFADEVFGTLAVQRARQVLTLPPVLLTDVNQTCEDNLKMALETRIDREPADKNRLRNCVLPKKEGQKITLIGKYEEHVAQTLAFLSDAETLTARDLSDKMTLSLNAASTRLKTLADLGLAYREEIRDAQGKQFIYRKLG